MCVEGIEKAKFRGYISNMGDFELELLYKEFLSRVKSMKAVDPQKWKECHEKLELIFLELESR